MTEICYICHIDFDRKLDSIEIIRLQCGHWFHHKCLIRYLDNIAFKYTQSCPYCDKRCDVTYDNNKILYSNELSRNIESFVIKYMCNNLHNHYIEVNGVKQWILDIFIHANPSANFQWRYYYQGTYRNLQSLILLNYKSNLNELALLFTKCIMSLMYRNYIKIEEILINGKQTKIYKYSP
jgi:hypothetical protein